MSIFNRVGKLERDRREGSVARALTAHDMTDRQLLWAIIEAEGITLSPEEMDAQFLRYQLTGEIPGMPGVTIEDVAAPRDHHKEE